MREQRSIDLGMSEEATRVLYQQSQQRVQILEDKLTASATAHQVSLPLNRPDGTYWR